jgi:hypothetical protein
MTSQQFSKLCYVASDLSEVVRETSDEDLTEILDQLLIYISKAEN